MGGQERRWRETVPALINIRHNLQCVQRCLSMAIYSTRERERERETDYVQLKECMCASQREKGKKKVNRENE